DLKKIRGVGAKTADKYGRELIDMVAAYRRKYGIEEVVLPEKSRSAPHQQTSDKGQRTDTRQTTLELFKKGNTPDQIAAARGLARSTIETHLSSLVHQGELGIDELLAPDIQESIEQAISAAEGDSLKEIKNMLGDEISYGQIKIVLAHQGTYVR
ncbi:MAG: helix-turn-helix domain-containing protein, partial [Desulfovermiculus sp.]